MSTHTPSAQESVHRIVLTEKAAHVVREAFESEKVDLTQGCVRVGARPGGCSGFRFQMDFADMSQVSENDQMFSSQGIQVVVDRSTLNEVMGSLEIDYQSGNLVEQGFKFRRLVEGAGACGCGESFSPIKG
ncbi:MAG: iron-sulfur cluster assembly accessory protein [Deltaproteobacteria bacterium]|nr:iron-sulfur cluster assembly accessory protein [Deltaproteobacteria bacterium]